MALPLDLPPPTAHPPLVSPKLGVSRRKCGDQPGKEDAQVHGFYAARHPHPAALDNSEFQPLGLSEYPVFVPPGFEKLSANSAPPGSHYLTDYQWLLIACIETIQLTYSQY
jgi:hypothetical protein